jgi:hypothetical protein
MIDGFFRIAFTGTAGSGFGMLVLRDGIVAGADMAGSIYDGTYTENPQAGEISLQFIMATPEGATPVQTGVPLAAPIALPITATLAQADIATEKLFLLQTQLGPVNVIFKKIRDFP